MLKVFIPNQNIRYTYGYSANNLISGKTYGYYEGDKHLLISDSPSELASAFSTNISNKSISSKDKIFFTKTCGYPSLLFSKLKEGGYKLDISRTIQSDKADKIIFKPNPIVRRSSYNSYYLTTLNENGSNRLCINIPNLTDIQLLAHTKNQLEQNFNRTFYYCCEIEDGETVELYLNNQAKAVSVIDLIKYVNSFLPPMSDLELDMAINYLKSSDEQARKLGIEMFLYNNLSDQLYNIAKKIITEVSIYYIPRYSEGSVAWKYLYTIFQFTDTDFREKPFCKNHTYFLKRIMTNPLNTSNLDDLKEGIKQQLIQRLKTDPEFKDLREDLELINCEIIIHDKNGETTVGD